MDTSQDRSLLFLNSTLDEAEVQELDVCAELLQRFREAVGQSLLEKRASAAKEDPAEELIELHLEVQEQERQFRECVEIGS